MGITGFSLDLVKAVLNDFKVETVIELGAQNMYDQDYSGNYPYADTYYRSRGIAYECIDLSGENGAQAIDLSKPCAVSKKYDMVTDFGTSEHVHDIKECWKTKHKLLKVGGVMISENPKVGNWPDHGYWYYTEEFYQKFAAAAGYKILKIGEHPAMWNTTDGYNVYCIMQKVEDKPFPDEFTGIEPSPVKPKADVKTEPKKRGRKKK